MSHWIKIKTEVRDLPALAEAAKELGCTLVLADSQRVAESIPGRAWHNVDAIINVPGSYYPIRVVMGAGGTYELSTESDYGGMIAKVVGESCRRLIQLYGVHRATAAARRQGYQVSRQPGQNGAINLVVNVS